MLKFYVIVLLDHLRRFLLTVKTFIIVPRFLSLSGFFGCDTMLRLDQDDPVISEHENLGKVNLQALMVIERSNMMKSKKPSD